MSRPAGTRTTPGKRAATRPRVGGRTAARAVLVAVVSAAALLVAACGGGGGAAGSGGGGGGTAQDLIIARQMDVNSLDPARAFCDTCQEVLHATYDTLTTVAPNAPTKPIPLLATSWQISPDFRTYTFHLNPKAVFADGTPVTSADVQWSWDRLAGLKGSGAFLMAGLKTITTPDAHTVVATFSAPNSAFLEITGAVYTGIVEKSVATAAGATTNAATDKASDWFMSHSAGSAPYTLTSYQANNSLVLTRNAKFWGAPAAFPKVTFKQVDDASAQLQELQRGDVDIASQLSPDSLSQLDGDSKVKAQTVDTYNFVYVLLDPAVAGAAPLKNPKVRQAIAAAIDYQAVIDATLGGQGRQQKSLIPSGFPGTAGEPTPAHDVAAAKKLLAEAGYGGGFSLTATYPTLSPYGVSFDTMFQKIQQNLSAVGIKLTLKPEQATQWGSQLFGSGLAMTAVYFAPDYGASSEYVGYFGMVPGGAWLSHNGGTVNQTEVKLSAQALAADGATQDTLYAQLAQEMAKDAISLPVVNPKQILAAGSNITGVALSAPYQIDLRLLGRS